MLITPWNIIQFHEYFLPYANLALPSDLWLWKEKTALISIHSICTNDQRPTGYLGRNPHMTLSRSTLIGPEFINGGYVLRNWTGHLIQAGAFPLGAASILVAETTALCNGLWAVVEAGFSKVIMGGDNQILIQAIQAWSNLLGKFKLWYKTSIIICSLVFMPL